MGVVILKAIFLGKVKVDNEKTHITVSLEKGKVDQQDVVFLNVDLFQKNCRVCLRKCQPSGL